MARLNDITHFLDDTLHLEKFPADPSNNGLQFEGTDQVRRAVFAVDACEEIFSAAIERDADFIFVHHGLSWGSGFRRITGSNARRFTALAANGISLYAAHLPLDAHEKLGHNILLAGMAGIRNLVPFGEYHGYHIGFQGELEKPVTLRALAKQFHEQLPSEGEFRLLGDPALKVRHPGVISGGGSWPELYAEIEKLGVDCLVTGEAGHTSFHYALESGTPVLMLGHYRSETPGVFAVMDLVRKKFRIETEFIDCPTGL